MKLNKLITLALCSTMLIGCGKDKGEEPDVDYGNWPSQEISDFLESVGLSEVVIPGIKLENEVETEISETDFFLFVDDEGTPGVDSLEDAYVKILEDANWDIDDSYYDEYGYFAYCENDLLSLMFATYEGVFSLGIYCSEPLEYGPWPSTDINSFLNEQGISGVTVPSLEGEFAFEILEDEYGEYAAISGEDPTNGMENLFKTALINANWDIDDSEYEEYGYFAVDSSEQVEIQFYSYDGVFVCYIYEYVGGGYEEEYFPWPVDEIDEWVSGFGLDTSIPSLDVDVSYFVLDRIVYLTTVDDGTPGVDSLEDVYLALLETAGWAIDDSNYEGAGYVATDDSGYLTVSFFTVEGYFTLNIIYEVPLENGQWPSDGIKSFLASEGVENIFIPNLDGDFSYCIDSDEYGSYFYIRAEDSGTIGVDSLEDLFVQKLSNYHWLVDDSEYDEYGYFADDPSGQVEIQFYSTYDVFYAYIYVINVVEEEPNSWPVNGIELFLDIHGVTGVTIPTLEGDFSGKVNDGAYVVECYDDGTPGVDSLEDAYLALLETAGWAIDDSDYDAAGYYATDPSGQIRISFFTYDGFFKAFIHVLEVKNYSVTTDDLGNTIITIDFASFMSDQEVFGGLNIEGYLNFSANKASGNNDPKYYDNGEALRLYWGNTLEFTPESGITISSIEFNLTESGNDLSSSTGTISKGTNQYTYTPNDGSQSQSLSVSGTKGQVRVSEIVITIAA